MVHGRRRVITTIDEFLDPSSGAAQMAPMVLRPGAIRAEIVQVDFGGVAAEVRDYSFPVVTRGQTVAGRVGVIVPLHRMMSGHINGVALPLGEILVFGASSEIAACNGEPTCCGILSIEPQVLQHVADALDIELDVPARGAFRAIQVAKWEWLRGLFLEVLRAVRDSNEVPTAIGDELVEMIARSLIRDQEQPAHRPSTRIDSVHIARRCEDYAATCSYQNVSIADLCEASGVSERRLRHAFYECYAMSPMGYLRIAALSEVHRTLLDGRRVRDGVSRAASDCGFWHLSRFAGQYRALFGELPSATLERGLARSESAAG